MTRQQMQVAQALDEREAVSATMVLVKASLEKLQPFDVAQEYTPEEYEPYDALSSRFVRAVEMFLKFFRSYELLQFAENSDTLRDQLNRMEKLGVVSNVQVWFEMRAVRNRIVHSYLPEKIKEMFDQIQGEFADELFTTLQRIESLAVE